ncbi:MAG TPA: AAA family ATPase, partial [Pseudobdellovibrionaceae bacterium]|nr:AAA family ATPase [Pseudobdellovibrionaceae bacterium]
ESITAKKAAQRAIFHVQRELEQLVIDEGDASVALCDRGTVDGVAYWPNSAESFWKEMGVKSEEEILRYHAVIHLRPPSESDGYNQRTNVLRIESAHQAELIDQKIEMAWKDHPRRFFVESTPRFIDKLVESVKILEGLLPEDCRKSLEQMTKTR